MDEEGDSSNVAVKHNHATVSLVLSILAILVSAVIGTMQCITSKDIRDLKEASLRPILAPKILEAVDNGKTLQIKLAIHNRGPTCAVFDHCRVTIYEDEGTKCWNDVMEGSIIFPDSQSVDTLYFLEETSVKIGDREVVFQTRESLDRIGRLKLRLVFRSMQVADSHFEEVMSIPLHWTKK